MKKNEYTKISKQEKLDVIFNIIKKFRVSNYEISKNTSISEAGLGSIVNGCVKNPRDTTVNTIYDYLTNTYANPTLHPTSEQDLPLATYVDNQGEGIPLIPLEAMAGIGNGEISVLELDCERYVIPMFKGADYLIPVKGSSMIPKYNSGDVVACKKLSLQDIFFQWNKVYVLDTEQGALIKRVCKGSDKDYITLVSDNEKYEPFELHLSKIYAIALVIGVVRLE